MNAAGQGLEGRTGARTVDQKALCACLTQAQAQISDRVRGSRPSFFLGADQHAREGRTGKYGFLARLNRAKPWHQPCFGGEGSQQALTEPMDGLDAQSATGRVENTRKQCSCAGALRRIARFAERLQIREQVAILHPDPGGQALADARRHLCGTGLGKRQAQDCGRLDAPEQQPEHARRQHLSLARAGRSGKPDMRIGCAGPTLLTTQGRQRADAITGHGRTIRRAASADHIRHRAHIRD